MKYEIYEANLAGLIARIDRLNRRAATLGAAPIACKLVSRENVPVEGKPGIVECKVTIDVSGETPKCNGWSFIGTLKHTSEGNVLRTMPGETVPSQYRDVRPYCDHCKTNRVRRDTYIVKHDDGTFKQVGSSCLKDFLGQGDPAKLASQSETVLNVFDLCEALSVKGSKGHNGLHIYRISLLDYLYYVADSILRTGAFVTRKMVQRGLAQLSTSDLALNAFRAGSMPAPSAEVVKLAEDARNWVIEKYAPHLTENSDPNAVKQALLAHNGCNDALSDFEHNLLVVASGEAIEPCMAGIAAYIVEAYRNANKGTDAKSKFHPLQLAQDGLNVLIDMFCKAKASLKTPAIRLMDDAKNEYMLSLAASTSKNAGCIYVKGAKVLDSEDGTTFRPYLGKITPDGHFYPTRECPKTAEAHMLAFSADPAGIATKYGRLTGRCCFCGRHLTDARSTDAGFGPVCASKFGLGDTWQGKSDEQTAEPPAVTQLGLALSPAE